MSIQFVTGADDRMFLHTLILLQTFANVGAAGAIKVCDFGFTKGQRSFLKAHGLLLVADPPISQNHHHPWYRKAALVDYIARDVDTVVWLDCDVMLTGDPRSEVAALVSEMRQSGEIVAACNEGFDLGMFCRNWETKGKNTVTFVRLLHQLGVASHHPYLNSGVFVAASRGWLAKWKEITFDTKEHFCLNRTPSMRRPGSRPNT